MSYQHELAVKTAQEWLDQKPLFFDSETTDLNGEIVELCILDTDGAVLLNTFISPTSPISDGARAVHRISDDMLAGAPSFAEVAPDAAALLLSRPAIAYNASFDTARIGTSLKAHALPLWEHPSGAYWGLDALALYSRFAGVNGRRSLSYAAGACNLSIPEGLHRARADAELCRLLVHFIAGRSPLYEAAQPAVQGAS